MRFTKSLHSLSYSRIRIALFLFIGAYVFLACSLWNLQIFNNTKYLRLSKSNRLRRILTPAQRGKIFDSNGMLLVDSQPKYNLVAWWDEIKDIPSFIDRLTKVMPISKETLNNTLRKGRRIPYVPIVLKDDLTKEQVISIEEAKISIPEISIQVSPMRHYYYKELAAHWLGYVGKISKNEYKNLKNQGYRINSTIGKMGIERTFDKYLRGKDGAVEIQVDSKGYRNEVLNEVLPSPGNNIYLTLDLELQSKMEEILKDKTAVGVAINPNTGGVLAAVSMPTFNPEIFTSNRSNKVISEIFADKSKPLMNRLLKGGYSPGSLYKAIVALAALENKNIDMQETHVCNGKFDLGKWEFNCWLKRGHGGVNVLKALRYSCNVFFYRTGLKTGIDKIAKMAYNFKIVEPFKTHIGTTITPCIPNRHWKRMTRGESWFPGDTCNISIGQGDLVLSPLHIISYFASIATGEAVEPFFLKRIVSKNGEIMYNELDFIKKRKIPVSEESLNIVRQGLHDVVMTSDGTGLRAQVEGVEIAGKTGTVQKGKGRTNNALFACWAPYKKPEIAVLILLEGAQSGGGDAAPLAQQVLQVYFDRKKTVAQDEEKKENNQKN